MDKLNRSVIFAVLLAATAMLWLAMPAEAAITSAQFVDVYGNVTNLSYDSQTQSYADGSLENPNVFVKICAGPGELLNKFTGIFYKVGSLTIPLQILPAQITSVDGSGCATVDLDINFFKARYAGIPQIVTSSSSDLSSPTFTALNFSTGYMRGNFTVKYLWAASNKLNVSITHAYDEFGSDLADNGNYILAGLLNSSSSVLDVAQVQLNESVNLSWDNNTNFSFLVNGIPIGQTFCNSGETLCDDGVCRPAGTCTLRGCINNVHNQICEIGEGCGCPDCNYQQDSCAQGLVCVNGVCGLRPAAPTGAVFGTRAPFECTWSSTYDDTALPGIPIRLAYFHECTPLREVLITVSGPFTGARIKTYGNESLFTKPAAPSEGHVFDYFKFEHNIPLERFDKVTIQFKISKQRLMASGISQDGISLQRLTDSGWAKLPANFTSEDNDYYYFESISPTLSLFAVVGIPVAVITPPAPPTPVPTPPPAVTPAIPIALIALAVLLVLIIIGLSYRWYARRPPVGIKPYKPLAITMPAPSRIPPEATQLQKKIAEIKKALEVSATKPAALKIQKAAKVKKEIGKAAAKPKAAARPKVAKPVKRLKPAKKIGKKKFYRALKGVEKELR